MGSDSSPLALVDQLHFIKGWLAKPLQVGAISPSGPALARRMAAFVDPSIPGSVVELGPGTGPVTRALLEHGVAPEELYAIEYSAEFAILLRAKYPGVNVVQGDAYALDQTLAGHRLDMPLNAVVSSLPLLTRPPEARRALLDKVLSMLRPGGAFIQFSYGLVPPIDPDPKAFDLDVTGWVVRNLPPARVFVYLRRAG